METFKFLGQQFVSSQTITLLSVILCALLQLPTPKTTSTYAYVKLPSGTIVSHCRDINMDSVRFYSAVRGVDITLEGGIGGTPGIRIYQSKSECISHNKITLNDLIYKEQIWH